MDKKKIKTPKVSIVIPVYNVEKFLNRCIDSVLNQTFDDFELILVNDGSTDNSSKICHEYEKLYPKITVIDTPNQGSSVARNVGLSKAVGQWIIHLDSDDWIEENMIKELYECAVNNDADIVACGFCQDDGVQFRRDFLYPYEPIEPRKELYRVGMQYSSACNKLVRKQLYDKYNIRFVEGVRMWEDLVVTTRLRYHSRKTMIVNKPLYHYFCGPRENICALDRGKYPESEIKVVEFLSKYFQPLINKDKNIKKILNSLKITAKKNLFSIESENSYNQWKSLYKEANSNILWMRHLPLKRRILMFLASKLTYKQLKRLSSSVKRLKKLRFR